LSYHSCVDCSKLNKKIKQISESKRSYRYGCEKNKFICGWLTKDNKLKEMGCSQWGDKIIVVKIEQSEQLSLF
jgi:hypothetical protein